MSCPVWVEIHVDDEIVGPDPARWPETAALLEQIAAIAEARGARLSFRIREPFALASAGSGLLPALAARGHEVGVHAHGRGLREALDAVRATGLQPTVATPGLVQGGAAGRVPLLRQAASLGFRRVTDHGPDRAWAYEGLLPRVEEGLVVMAPAVRPPDWGLMAPDGRRLGLRAEAVARLRALEAAAFARHGARHFGVALHEHDLCPPGSLIPAPESLDALAALLDVRVVPSAAVPAPEPPPQGTPRRILSDTSVRFARAIRATAAVARWGRGRGWRPPAPGGFRLPVGEGAGRRFIVVERHGPEQPAGVIAVCTSGRRGGRGQGLSAFGVGIAEITGHGWAIYLYDRAGTGRSPPAGPLAPGNRAHQEDWRAVLALARQERAPVVALTWSAGLLPVLQAAAAGDRPDALIDGEAPADRWSLVPPEGNELSALDPWDDGRWQGLEPAALIGALGAPYARLQGTRDHVHDAVVEHARRMIAAAQAAGLAVYGLDPVPGLLHGHPLALLEALAWVRERWGQGGGDADHGGGEA